METFNTINSDKNKLFYSDCTECHECDIMNTKERELVHIKRGLVFT